VLPLSIHQHGEQATVQLIHRIVFMPEFGGSARITRQHHFLGAIPQLHGELAHLGEVPVDFLRHGVHRVPPVKRRRLGSVNVTANTVLKTGTATLSAACLFPVPVLSSASQGGTSRRAQAHT
jgi:hypothetical protein